MSEGWTEGDVKTIFLQGVIPLVVGLGLCFLGCLYLLGILQWSCKKHDDQVAPVVMAGEESNDGVMTRAAAEKAYGPVACEAELFGMQCQERQSVLEAIFSDCGPHKETAQALKERQSAEESDLEQGGIANVDIDTRCACAICLREYEDNDEVLSGPCQHMFHKQCCLLWLTNYRKPKDHCPYCRKEMFTAVQMKTAALEVLGQERVKELSHFPTTTRELNTNTTTTTFSSNSNSNDTEDVPVEEVPDVENDIQEQHENEVHVPVPVANDIQEQQQNEALAPEEVLAPVEVPDVENGIQEENNISCPN